MYVAKNAPTMNCVYYKYYITPDGINYHKHFILVITNMIAAVCECDGKSLTILLQG